MQGFSDSKLGNPPSSLGAGKIDESYLIPNSCKTSNAQIFSFLNENPGARYETTLLPVISSKLLIHLDKSSFE